MSQPGPSRESGGAGPGGHAHGPHAHAGHGHPPHAHPSHDHGHGHAHGSAAGTDDMRRLAWTLVLVVVYMGAEVVGGLLADSLALLADAGHMLSDAGSLGLALFAVWISRRAPTSEKTFGYYRTEILAALANGAVLVAIAFYIFFEAWERLQAPPAVAGPLMMAIAAGGLAVNAVGLVLLHGGKDRSLNLKGAWLHVMADALGSIGALVAGALVWRFGWDLADPVASVLIGLLVLASSWTLLKESLAVLMEAAPRHIDVDALHAALRGVDGVVRVHHLHVWTIGAGLVSLSAHLVEDGTRDRDEVLRRASAMVRERFGIDHATIQVEPEDFDRPDIRV